jgi:hypothetical protein
VFQKARRSGRAFFTLADNAGTTVKLQSNPRDLPARDVSARLSKPFTQAELADKMAFMHAQSGNKRGRLVRLETTKSQKSRGSRYEQVDMSVGYGVDRSPGADFTRG